MKLNIKEICVYMLTTGKTFAVNPNFTATARSSAPTGAPAPSYPPTRTDVPMKTGASTRMDGRNKSTIQAIIS